MSTIVISSEDEDEFLILDDDEQVNLQPPHMVFILQDKHNDNLLKEDDSESNKDDILGECCNLGFEELGTILSETSSNPFTEEVFENKSPVESENSTTQPTNSYQSFSDEDTCDLKRFEHNYVNNNLESPANEIAKQDNNVIFQRLAEALSTALSSPLDLNAEECLNNKPGNIDLRSEEIKNFDTDNAANGKFVKTNEPLNQTNNKSQSCPTLVENPAVIAKKRGRKPGWRKSSLPNPSKSQISGHSSTTIKKKPGRKPGWRKSIEPNPCSKPVPKENTSTILQKRGRKPGWRKMPKSFPKGNSPVRSNPVAVSDRSEDEVYLKEIIKSDDTTNKNKSSRKPVTRKKINKSSKSVIDHDLFTTEMENKTKDTYLSSKNNVSKVISRGSSDLLNPSSDSTLQISSPYFDKPKTPEGRLKPNPILIEDLNESCANKLPEPNLSLNIQPKLTGDVEQDAVILKEDFVRCYNKIFCTNTERLSTRLGDILLLAMKEVKNYKDRINSAKKLTCEQLRNEEMYITEDGFKNNLDKYRTSFCAMFHEILSLIMSKEEVIYQQKALLLAVFLKIFVRVSTLSPEYLDSLILAKYSMTSLLKDYLLTVPESIYVILHATFWQSDTDFERNCWFILDFCLTSLSEQNDNSNNMMDKTDRTTTLKNVNQYLTNKFQPQAITTHNSAEVSVIVRNQYHKEERCSSPAKSNNYSRSHPVRQADNHVNSSLSNTSFKQFLSANIKNETDQYAVNNMQSVTEESIGKDNRNNSKSTDEGSLSRPTEIHDAIFLQTSQHATLHRFQPNDQRMIKENTTKGFVGVKRKNLQAENCSIKIAKTTENQIPVNPTIYSQQNIPMNSEYTSNISLQQAFADNNLQSNGSNTDNLNKSFHISNSNSEVRRCFSPSYYSCKGFDFTLTPDSNEICSSKEQSADKNTNGYGVPLPHAHPQNILQFQHGPVNLSTNRSYMDSGHKPIESTSLPNERNPHNHQKTRYTPYYESQQNLGFHQSQSYSAAYGQKFSYHNQTSPQYNQYLNSSVNYQLQNQPNLRLNQAALRYHQQPNSYTPTYGCSPYRTNPRLDIYSVKSSTENPLVSDTHKVAQYICPSTLPKQMQRIISNSGITINNYNIKTCVPPLMPQHTSHRVNSGPYFCHNTTNSFNGCDIIQSKHMLAPESVSRETLHHKATV